MVIQAHGFRDILKIIYIKIENKMEFNTENFTNDSINNKFNKKQI